MSWRRWWAVVVLATLEAALVSVGAGDFDQQQRSARQQAAIQEARTSSGVDPTGGQP